MRLSTLLCLALPLANAGTIPKGAGIGDHVDLAGDEFLADGRALQRRAGFGPISTASPAGVAGGTIANAAPPVSSFFRDLKPPVCFVNCAYMA